MSTSEHDEQSFGDASGRELQRNLTNRHIQLIAIGGAIGTGLLWVPERPSQRLVPRFFWFI